MRGQWFLALVLAACARDGDRSSTTGQEHAPHCDSARRVAELPSPLNEASGVAVSIRHAGILWVHNDSGEPVVFAIDTLGNLRGRVRVPVPNIDWEDIDVAPCPEGSCIYLGAIGDNLQSRTDRAVLRFPEPDLDAKATGTVTRFRYRLPTAAHDIEALFVVNQRMFLITKGRSGPVTMFGFPAHASADEVSVLEELQQLTPGLVQLPDMVTSAGATRDGKSIVVRTYSALQLYSLENDRLTTLLPGTGFDLQALHEFQGEGADIAENGSVYLVSEKGLGDEDPPLSKVSCALGN